MSRSVLLPLVVLFTTFGCASADKTTTGPGARCADAEAAATEPALDPSTKRDDIRAVLELTGAATLAKQVMDPILTQFQKMSPEVPAAVWDRIRDKFNEDDLLDMVIEIYDEELSHEDIVAMRRFYESDAGRRITASLPTITTKAQEAGREWGQQVAREVVDELIAEGYAGK